MNSIFTAVKASDLGKALGYADASSFVRVIRRGAVPEAFQKKPGGAWYVPVATAQRMLREWEIDKRLNRVGKPRGHKKNI